MKIKTVIVDDEQLARQRVLNLLNEFEGIDVMGECPSGEIAIETINAIRPALVFLDIELKDMTGFEVLEKISRSINPVIIFLTAFDEFAIKAFEYFAFDYLKKPFRDDRFYKSVNKAIERIKKQEPNLFDPRINSIVDYVNDQQKSSSSKTVFPIKIGNKTLFIKTQDIKYIIASGYYAEIYTEDKKYLLRESLMNLIEKLNSSYFHRIHRSTIINLNFIQELINSNYGEIDVKMMDNKIFRISKSYKKDFLQAMDL
ncbi:MAG: LytTR family transcriptional regulator DNA-binding domain-containing protein [Allomuricauda sp.]